MYFIKYSVYFLWNTKWQKYLSLDFDVNLKKTMESVFSSFVKSDNLLYFAVQIMHDYMVHLLVICDPPIAIVSERYNWAFRLFVYVNVIGANLFAVVCLYPGTHVFVLRSPV